MYGPGCTVPAAISLGCTPYMIPASASSGFMLDTVSPGTLCNVNPGAGTVCTEFVMLAR